MNQGTLLLRSTDVLVRSFAGEVLLASPSGGDVDHLQGTASVVWDLLDEPRSLDDLVDGLADAYRTPRSRVSHDVEALIGDLIARGWVLAVADTDD